MGKQAWAALGLLVVGCGFHRADGPDTGDGGDAGVSADDLGSPAAPADLAGDAGSVVPGADLAGDAGGAIPGADLAGDMARPWRWTIEPVGAKPHILYGV